MSPYFTLVAIQGGDAREVLPEEQENDTFPDLRHPGAEGALLDYEEISCLLGALLDRKEQSTLIDLRKAGHAFEQHAGGA